MTNNGKRQNGIFTVSLDFELYWGMRDKRAPGEYDANITGGVKAIPAILSRFATHQVHATWATVGFIFFKSADELKAALPTVRPTYDRPNFSPYAYIESADELRGDLHFAPGVIDAIRRTPGQEVGSHTLSHYYCLEPGQNKQQFNADIAAAATLAKQSGFSVTSLVFPRNQWNPDYLPVLTDNGIRCFRGTEDSWMYRATDEFNLSASQRLCRLLDSYINVSGHHVYSLESCADTAPYNLRSSRFLRPYSHKLRFFEPLRIKRIKDSMTQAAQQGKVFHLWWHPHNFGTHTEKNLAVLERILEHYSMLRKTHGMQSMNMAEMATSLDTKPARAEPAATAQAAVAL